MPRGTFSWKLFVHTLAVCYQISVNRRSLLLLLGAILAMGAGKIATLAAVDPIVGAITSTLSTCADWLPAKDSPVDPPPVPEGTRVLRERPAVSTALVPRRQPTNKPKPSGGILVRREVVRSAVARGIRPSAHPVAATDERPGGLVVHGWGAAGAGLADGDIITFVGGRVPKSVDDVVVAVAGAYKGKSPAVSGQVWRNGQVLAVTVELPRMDQGEGEAERSSQRSASRFTGGP